MNARVGPGDERRSEPWEQWMRGMGRYTRRLRELCGLSQEQLARLAGVSQGAVSRLEMGRATNAPLVIVMKINAAMRRALAGLDPTVLSEESRRLMSVPARGIPATDADFDAVPVTSDPLLGELVALFWAVPGPQRAKLVEVVRTIAGMLRHAGPE
jgi:transcriptional regulator with XRE-family HTH domain